VEEQGGSGFQLSLAWRGLRAPEVRLCTFHTTIYVNKQESGNAGWSMSIASVAIWRRRVLCNARQGIVV